MIDKLNFITAKVVDEGPFSCECCDEYDAVRSLWVEWELDDEKGIVLFRTELDYSDEDERVTHVFNAQYSCAKCIEIYEYNKEQFDSFNKYNISINHDIKDWTDAFRDKWKNE